MAMDFANLKNFVKPDIVDKYDHLLVLNANSLHAKIDFSAFEKVFFLLYHPNTENLVTDFALQIQSKLPISINLYKVVLSKTASLFAEGNSKDQQC